MTPPLPKQIGRYEVRSELGWGAAGRVFLALDPTVDRKVAVKLMAPRTALAPDEEVELRERFLLEARAAGRLHHPNVVLVWDAGIDPDSGLPYLAMEHVDGIGLERLLSRDKALDPELAAAIGIQVAKALDHAHREGIVHRDVKPANILLARDGTVKIGDFGIARVEGLALTRTGIVLGSPLYMSPEQVCEETLDGRSDLFSLAAVLFEAASGEPPFPGSNLASVTWRIAWGDPDAEAAERIPAALRRVLLGALTRDPNGRPASGSALAAALGAASGLPRDDPEGKVAIRAAVERLVGPVSTVLETAVTTRLEAPAATARPKRLPLLIGVLSLALLAALALLAVGTTQRPKIPTKAPALGTVADPQLPPATEGVVSTPLEETGAAASPANEGVSHPSGQPQSPSTPTDSTTPFPEPPLDITRPLPRGEAALELVIRLRLRSARIAVRVDGQQVWAEPLDGPRNVFSRMLGRDVAARIPLDPGEHKIEVRLEGSSMAVSARTMFIANFEAGVTRRLRLSLNPYTDNLDWRWIEETAERPRRQ